MKIKNLTLALFGFIFICCSLSIKAQAPYGNSGDHTAVPLGSSSCPFGYYEYLPTDFNSTSGNTYAVVISYHGYSQRGNGTSELGNVISTGPARLVQQGSNFEAIVISPQNATANYFENDFLNLYNYLVANYPVDLNRVYVTGLSSGGGSTWHALKGHSDKIAGAIPVCGYNSLANPSSFLQDTPIWAFHSFDDNTIDVSRTINHMDRIANNGNSVMDNYPYQNISDAASEDYSMQFDTSTQDWSTASGTNGPSEKLAFTLYKDGGHNSWTRTYNNSEVWNWLFAQSLNDQSLSLNKDVIDYKLYPNPASDTFTIISTHENEKTLEIYDLFGTKIYVEKFSREIIINTTSYASGIYFAKVTDDNNSQKVTKLIIN
ncbi:T9SS type A sorting domain-containing protein [Winogradskyella sp. R77965]|uniref:T9SS type A sorting domain-containing protein n=1 Tax=Winogradskyella sp. R77965 TaxID=3093872 RepID=UPI0037DC6303